MKRAILSTALALSLIGAILAPVASAATCSAQYTVLPGDNLFRIGLKFGVSWPDIAVANNLPNASLIFPGQVLCIPSAAGGTPAPTATGPTPTPKRRAPGGPDSHGAARADRRSHGRLAARLRAADV